MNARARIGDVVAVEWLDAWFDADETRESDWKDSMMVTTYGELRRYGRVVTIVSEPSNDGVCRSSTHIPRGMVQRVAVLRKGKS